MHLGIHLIHPQGADPTATLRASADAAEALGYRTLWIGDRLVGGGAQPTSRPTGPLDALAVLAHAAALTERVRLGTSVLAGAWYRPALLARSLATVDLLSRGRLTVGVGTSASGPDAAAAGVSTVEEAARLADVLEQLATMWASHPPAVGPAPTQQPRPPLLVSSGAPMARSLVGHHADGWIAAAPAEGLDELARRWAEVEADAVERGAGAPPQLVAQVEVGSASAAGEIADRIGRLGELGATEVVLAGDRDQSLDHALATYAAVAEAAELRIPA